MLDANMTHNGGEGWARPNGGNTAAYNSMGRLGHYTAGLIGLLVTIGLLFILYPMVVAVTKPLHVLSSTAIVMLGVFTWVVLWCGIDFVMDRRMA